MLYYYTGIDTLFVYIEYFQHIYIFFLYILFLLFKNIVTLFCLIYLMLFLFLKSDKKIYHGGITPPVVEILHLQSWRYYTSSRGDITPPWVYQLHKYLYFSNVFNLCSRTTTCTCMKRLSLKKVANFQFSKMGRQERFSFLHLIVKNIFKNLRGFLYVERRKER